MRKIISAVVGSAFAIASFAVPASAQGSMPTIWSASKAENAKVEEVQHHRRHYRGHHGYRGHRGYYGHRHYRGSRGAGVAVGAGLLGLGIGAAIASQQQPRYYGGGNPDWHAYCASKYRSYDARTGTFLGYDGYRHPCR